MEKKQFGRTAQGAATLYAIANTKGMRVLVTDFGATLVSIFVKDKNGADTDVILGYEDASEYEKQTCYFGATVGRNCNRISDAKIMIDDTQYILDANDNENNLHSGANGLSERIWEVKEYQENKITLTAEDADMQQGFPGNAAVAVTYEVTEENGLKITYHATADKKTLFNFTNHSYFNLNGEGTAMDHVLQIKASHYTPVKSEKAIPTGEIASVEGTPFDFRTPKIIGQDIDADNEQLRYGNGYDHNYAIDKEQAGMETVAGVYSEKTGIRMDVSTDCIGIQLYTANFIRGQKGKGGVVYDNRDAFCLETQYFPNSINEPNFTTPLTEAGEAYHSETVYTFSLI